jgi:fructose/tagatose bisphosphate aldolase
MPPSSGLPALEHINRETERLRAIIPSVVVAFATEARFAIRRDVLPPHVYMLGEVDLGDIIASTARVRTEQCWATRNRGRTCAEAVLDRDQFSELRSGLYRGPAPNYNVKHLSMLLPFGLASAETGREIFCEISPQEAVLYHAGALEGDMLTVLSKVFRQLRMRIDEINAALGSQLRLHLDHSDDLDVILAACDSGFDSVMADGSGLSLAQNIIFTKAAQSRVRTYDIPVEGEIGCIDGRGQRKWNKTRFEDFQQFVAETGIDFVGVNIGQFHGFNYGFAATRGRLAEIDALDGTARGRGHRALSLACMQLDKELEVEGFSKTSGERQLLLKVVREAMYSRGAAAATVDDILDATRRGVPLYKRPLVDRLESAWLARRQNVTQKKLSHWEAIIADRVNTGRGHGLIDHELLGEFAAALSDKSTLLVIHGGSSIAREDLEELWSARVARVNFGSEVFSEYLEALRARVPGVPSPAGLNHSRKMAFLADATRQWRDWIQEPPEFVTSYVDRLIAMHMEPLSVRTSG